MCRSTPSDARATAAATTSFLTCLATMTRASARFWATVPCRQARSARRAWPSPIARNGRSTLSRRADMATDDRFPRGVKAAEEDEPVGFRNKIITGPVSDWTTDFSHLEPEWAADPYLIQDELRQR